MSSTISRGIILGLVVLSVACGQSTPTAPTGNGQATVPSVPAPPPTNFPALSGSSRTFAFDHQLESATDWTKGSRFVLYDTGGFALRSQNGSEARGGYTEANGIITFQWEIPVTALPWGATGTLTDDLLIVRYNGIMRLSDFEDAAYRLTQ